MPIVGMVVQPTLDSDVYEESALSCLPTLLITSRKQDIRPRSSGEAEMGRTSQEYIRHGGGCQDLWTGP